MFRRVPQAFSEQDCVGPEDRPVTIGRLGPSFSLDSRSLSFSSELHHPSCPPRPCSAFHSSPALLASHSMSPLWTTTLHHCSSFPVLSQLPACLDPVLSAHLYCTTACRLSVGLSTSVSVFGFTSSCTVTGNLHNDELGVVVFQFLNNYCSSG